MTSIKELHERYGKDINQQTNLVMSGVESDAYWDIAIGAGIERLLVSYHYIQRKGKKFLRDRLAKNPNVKIMIDSGAYTFHVKEDEYKQKPMEFWDKYLEKYTNFIRENKDLIFAVVELDIANIVGFDKVDEFRRKYFEPLKEDGLLVCYVWHGYDGKKYWEEMCKKYDYVGFSLENSDLKESEIMRMVNVARRHNAVVHGFAVTRVDLMSRVPFFTGDSTTWLVGTQYGELNWFDGRKMKRLKKADWKTTYKQKFIKLGANWDLAGEENPYELIRINLLVFKEAEKYIRKRVKGKMYWMDKSAGAPPVTRGLSRRPKPAIEEEEVKETVSIKPKKKLVRKKKKPEAEETVGDNFKAVTKEEVEQEIKERLADMPEKPKTKFEIFSELSKTSAPEIRDFDAMIAALPTKEWFEGDTEDYLEYARAVGLPSTMGKEDILDILFNYAAFLRDGVEDIPDADLISLAEILANYTGKDREEALAKLIEYYSGNITGIRNDFKEEDLPSGEAPPRPKEREEYLEDDAYEMKDMTDDELASFLPAPIDADMPEVDELDKELGKQGIVAVRDDKGRFLKGQKKVRKPKNLASKHFPKLACNTCYKAGECPEYKPDYACAYEKIFKKFDTRDFDDVLDGMHSMTNMNMERMQRLMLFETMDGGMPDPTLTSMIDQNMRLLQMTKQMHEQKAQIVATQRRTIRADGSEETVSSVSNPNGGILAQIFGMGNQEDSKRREMNEEFLEQDLAEENN